MRWRQDRRDRPTPSGAGVHVSGLRRGGGVSKCFKSSSCTVRKSYRTYGPQSAPPHARSAAAVRPRPFSHPYGCWLLSR
eukprot:5344217-Prymnesium_polylepis.1